MNDQLPPRAIDALRNGRKIEAIKILREASGIGLKEAKEAVERFEDEHPPGDVGQGGAVQRTGRGNGVVLLVVLVAIVLAAWLLMR